MSRPEPLVATCLGCGREFATENVVLFGRTFAADRYCELCRQAEQAKEDERAAERRWARASVPASHAHCSFANYEPEPGTVHALEVCRQWTKEYRAGTSLHRGVLLHGSPGGGKTHLAVAMLREIVWSGRPVPALFLNVPAWLNTLRESYSGPSAEPPANPFGYAIVVLDDLGAEHWTDWARDRIYSLINQREQERRMIIVTTNCTPGELAGRVGGPTASRLRRLAADVHVDARRDFRDVLVERGAA